MGHTRIEMQAMDATIETARQLGRIADALEVLANIRVTQTVDALNEILDEGPADDTVRRCSDCTWIEVHSAAFSEPTYVVNQPCPVHR